MVVFGVSSYFELILDTTQPTVSVYAPSKVYHNETIEIIIKSDEKIDKDYQEFLVKDDTDKLHKFVGTYNEENNEFVCLFSASGLKGKLCTIKATVRDEVNNEGYGEFSFVLVDSSFLKVEIDRAIRKVNITKNENRLSMKGNQCKVKMFKDNDRIKIKKNKRRIEVERHGIPNTN